MNNYSLYVQDSWRVTPTLTLNAGLRWDVQTPFSPVNDTMSPATLADMCGVSGLGDGGIYNACNFFAPGRERRQGPEFSQFTTGTHGYNTDWNNLAPNIGVAWRPNVQSGWLRTLLGDPEQATLRGGYSVAYDRQGLGVFTGVYGANPGSTLSLTRDANTGLVPPGESWPVLLRDTSRLYPAPFPETPTYPIACGRTARTASKPSIPTSRSPPPGRGRSASSARLTTDMAVEVRYVGTRGVNQWSELNYNERNLIENGFHDEFMPRDEQPARRTTSRAARGAARSRISGPARAPARCRSIWPTSTAAATPANPGRLHRRHERGPTRRSPQRPRARPTRARPTRRPTWTAISTRRNNALAAGLPANFFVVNPDADDVNVTDSGAFSDYHALQIELRRRLSQRAAGQRQLPVRARGRLGVPRLPLRARDESSTDTSRHAIKTQWDWTIPVGRGQRFGSDLHPMLDGVLGGLAVHRRRPHPGAHGQHRRTTGSTSGWSG